MRKIFVTGIGTDVGKTFVSAVLTEALKADYWKPVQCGFEPITDSALVKKLLSNTESKIQPETYLLKEPLSPHAAAQRENVVIDLKKITLPDSKNSALIIEGAGGLMVPLNDKDLMVDLITYFKAETIVVADFYLGSINHTLLTCSELKNRSIPVTGIIFNGDFNQESADIILKQTGLKMLGAIPREKEINAQVVSKYASQFKNVQMGLVERDKAVVWHPYTDDKLYGTPVPVVSAQGAYLFAENGDKYLDAVSSWWTNIHGHSHPHIVEKVTAQIQKLDHVIFSGFTHEPAIVLAEKLLKRLPSNQSKIFYSDNGSTAVEVAVKMALQYWYNKGEIKNKVIAFKNGYHGDTFGAMSVSSRSTFTKPFENLLFDVIFIDLPVKGNEEKVISQLESQIENHKTQISSFIFEPLVQGTAGMLMYEPEVLSQLLSICKKNNIITIADEVLTGFGRTGKFFATDYMDTKPDLFCLSKGLTGGTMAFGVTSCTQNIYEAFSNANAFKKFFHGHSYTANPIACSAAIAGLELFEQGNVFKDIERISKMHEQFVKKIRSSVKIKEARSKGTILAIELTVAGGADYFNDTRANAYTYFMSKKILMRPLGNIIYVMPPYCVSNDDLNYIYNSIEYFLGTL